MQTKINEKTGNKQREAENTVELRDIYVEIPTEEFSRLKEFYSISGIYKAFSKQYPGHLRQTVFNAILTKEDGSPKHRVRLGLLKDMRAFYETHKNEVKEFINI